MHVSFYDNGRGFATQQQRTSFILQKDYYTKELPNHLVTVMLLISYSSHSIENGSRPYH